MRPTCHARGRRADVDRWGRRADVDRRITTGSRVATWSRRSDTSRSQWSCIFKKPWQNRAFTSFAQPGEVLLVGFWVIRARGPRLVVLSPRGSHVEWEKRWVIARFCVLHQNYALIPTVMNHSIQNQLT
ncbi:hypothetical protein Taro_024665 [Colocasia esculenta]|uniref:Uncharacterized protein n=1 Tax=Colocasia esculenta TaxID=4460 RepID=A0A843VBY5_COLES|nr:hypothetical protein [Colocasia esculenta]